MAKGEIVVEEVDIRRLGDERFYYRECPRITRSRRILEAELFSIYT